MSNELLQAGLQRLAKTAADIYRGFADISQAQTNNGISTKGSKEIIKEVLPETTTTTTHTHNVRTVDHELRRAYQNRVAAKIERTFNDFGAEGVIRLGDQTIKVEDLVESVGLIIAGLNLSGSKSTKGHSTNADASPIDSLNELFNQLKAASELAGGEEPSTPVPTNEEPSASATTGETVGNPEPTLPPLSNYNPFFGPVSTEEPKPAEEAQATSRKRRKPKVDQG